MAGRLFFSIDRKIEIALGVSFRHAKMWQPPVFPFSVRIALYLLGFAFSSSTFADCSTSKIKRLHEQGKTIAAIAKSCDMEKGDIKEILEEESDKLAPGTPLTSCGCWGAVTADARRPADECQRGYARPRMCPGWCTPLGGAPWQDVCSR